MVMILWTRVAGCTLLWNDIQQICIRLGSTKQLANLTVNMVGGGNAVVSALKAMASENRHLVPVMKELCIQHSDGSVAHSHRIRADACIEEFVGIVGTHVLHIPRAGAERMYTIINMFALQYTSLTVPAMRGGRLLFNPQYKLHQLFQSLLFSICEPAGDAEL